MHSFHFDHPIPLVSGDALPPCPAPQDCGEPLCRIDRQHARIAYAASYRAQGLSGATQGCYVRQGLVPMLMRAVAALPEAYTLLIFDAYRPIAVQQALYDQYTATVRTAHPDWDDAHLLAAVDDFVALPVPNLLRPAPHTTGGAVDLTLCRSGVPLDMGTEFDDFTEKANTAWYENAAASASPPRENRRLLYNVMSSAGFVNYEAEWWHYSFGDRLWARTFGKTPIYGYCAYDAGLL